MSIILVLQSDFDLLYTIQIHVLDVILKIVKIVTMAIIISSL